MTSTPKRAKATLAELTVIVRPPGEPTQIRTFTTDELDEARAYAAATGAAVEDLGSH